MKIAAWIGHEAARDERAADIGSGSSRKLREFTTLFAESVENVVVDEQCQDDRYGNDEDGEKDAATKMAPDPTAAPDEGREAPGWRSR